MSYTEAKEKYAALGVDTEAALTKLKTVPLSLHCWQGDDVSGFENPEGSPPTPPSPLPAVSRPPAAIPAARGPRRS